MNHKAIDQKKVERYKLLLREEYWEIYEAAYIISGQIDFDVFYNFDPKAELRVKRKRIGSVIFEESSDQIATLNLLCTALLRFTLKDDSDIVIEKMRFCSRCINGCPGIEQQWLFLRPEDAIAVAVTEGFVLSNELQELTGLHQSKEIFQKLTLPHIKQMRRATVIQFFLNKNQKMSAGAICREMGILRRKDRSTFNSMRGKPLV